MPLYNKPDDLDALVRLRRLSARDVARLIIDGHIDLIELLASLKDVENTPRSDVPVRRHREYVESTTAAERRADAIIASGIMSTEDRGRVTLRSARLLLQALSLVEERSATGKPTMTFAQERGFTE